MDVCFSTWQAPTCDKKMVEKKPHSQSMWTYLSFSGGWRKSQSLDAAQRKSGPSLALSFPHELKSNLYSELKIFSLLVVVCAARSGLPSHSYCNPVAQPKYKCLWQLSVTGTLGNCLTAALILQGRTGDQRWERMKEKEKRKTCCVNVEQRDESTRKQFYSQT